jgi:hypothetical protein
VRRLRGCVLSAQLLDGHRILPFGTVPATMVIASNRCCSLGMWRPSHAKKRKNSPSMAAQYFNAGETSPRRTSHFK